MPLETSQTGCFIGSPILFNDLIDEAGAFSASSLEIIKRRRRVHASVPLYLEGDFPREMYIIVEGEAEIRQRLGGRHVPIRKTIPGEILGIRESISRHPIEYDIATSSECVIDVITRRDFVRFVRSDCKICFRLLRAIGNDLQTSYKTFISCPEFQPSM
jgi:CRP-like cAMP-binding protein